MSMARRLIRRGVAMGLIVTAPLLPPASFPRSSSSQLVTVSHMDPNSVHAQRSVEALDSLLRQDPDVRALLEIREEMTRRALRRGVSPITLKAAYEMKDEEKVRRMLGYSQAEIMVINYRLDRARWAILEKFPEIAQLVKEQWSASCAINPSLYRCGAEHFFDSLNESEESKWKRSLVIGDRISQPWRLVPLPVLYGIGFAHMLLCVVSVEADGLTRFAPETST